jgi:hypothetical protein
MAIGAYGRHDPAARRKAQRRGRERGCWVYIPAGSLQRAGIDPGGSEPYYRTWVSPRGSLVVRLYRQP